MFTASRLALLAVTVALVLWFQLRDRLANMSKLGLLSVDSSTASGTSQAESSGAQESVVRAAAGVDTGGQANLGKLGHSPSFDCRQIRNLAEAAVCRDSTLSRMDREYAQLYVAAMRAADDRELFKREGQRRLVERNRLCEDKDCLERWYTERMLALDSIIAGREHQ